MKRRILSIVTALALCLSLCPTWAFAAEPEPDTGLCAHHLEHIDCGYIAPSEGQPCNHEHMEDCFTADEDGSEVLDCQHEHDEACGYIQADPGQLCGYECPLCPIEALLAALPSRITADNAETVRWHLEEILDLYRELSGEEQAQLDLTLCYELLAELAPANAPAPAAEEVPADYQEATWNGSAVTYSNKTAENCTSVENSTDAVTWNEGWYVVTGTATISQPITVSGDVKLILADGCTLNAEQGIVVTTGNSLTIYAQAGGSGTLNATGVYQTFDAYGNAASAGIGGGTVIFDSGDITIHGGTITATGGSSIKSVGGAGIGGSTGQLENGGSSGIITIFDGTVTATSGQGNTTGAGIGGGAGDRDGTGGAGSNITIYGGKVTATSTGTQAGSAGIGGGVGCIGSGGAGSNITISGGIVKAKGGSMGAGIGGGGSSSNTGGAGIGITISGGEVTAEGGRFAAGIGGGGGYGSNITGGTGTGIIITGGIVDATGGKPNSSGDYAGDPIGNGGNAGGDAGVTKTAGIIFENGAGKVYGTVALNKDYTVPDGYALTIQAGASLSGSGTLSGGGDYLIEGLTADMISVPESWSYTGEDLTEQIKGVVSLSGDAIICGQTFHADTTGWELSVTKVTELKYTVTYTHTDEQPISKDVIIAKAQTTRLNVDTYLGDGSFYAENFFVGDTFIVKATPVFPVNNAIMTADFTEPDGGQMAVYYDGKQISEPSTVDENGVHTMTVNTYVFPPEAYNKEITITVKYMESDHASGAEAETKVKIIAVATVEIGGVTTYYGRIGDAWTAAKGHTATVTLLRDAEGYGLQAVGDGDNIILNGGEHTLRVNTISVQGGELTITGGSITASTDGVNIITGGTLTVTGGTIDAASRGSGILVGNGTVSISGDAVIIGKEYGVQCSSDTAVIRISGGSITGYENAVLVDLSRNRNASSLLENYGGTTGTHYAFYQDGQPVNLSELEDEKNCPAGPIRCRSVSTRSASTNRWKAEAPTKWLVPPAG